MNKFNVTSFYISFVFFTIFSDIINEKSIIDPLKIHDKILLSIMTKISPIQDTQRIDVSYQKKCS